MLQSFQHSDFATQFHKTYYLTLMQEIFAVMTGMLAHLTVSSFISSLQFRVLGANRGPTDFRKIASEVMQTNHTYSNILPVKM